ncbi:MAG: GumC family protein, partial [Candidatus Heimdallarchaeota archaeon]
NNLIEQLNYREELLKGEVEILTFYDIDQKGENVAKIYRLLHSEPSNKLLEELLLNSKTSKYSVKSISDNLTASRKGNSDMIELSYIAKHPVDAQKTLIVILDVFSNKQNQLKETEALNVIKYFESKLTEIEGKLHTAEENLKRFKEQNGVINFQSQTDMIARQKETMQLEYDKELMTLKGAQKAKARLEIELKNKNNLPHFNNSMIHLQNQLSSLNDRKVRAELSNNRDSVRILDNRIKKVETELQTTLTTKYASTVTVSSQEILSSWLVKTIEESESEARLKVFQQRLAQTAREYDTYAPLGSKLNKFQRQQNIHEKEYLQILNDLNQAKIRQNNIATANLVDIVDYPSKPIQPEPNKKILYVLIAGIIGFLTIATLIFIKVFFDNSIRTPQRAEKMIQLEVIGVLPKIKKKKKKYYDQLINQILSK